MSLRDAMDAAGFARTSIVIPDGAYDGGILDRFRRDANFSRALSGGGVAVHYPCYVPRPEVTMSGLKYWASEEQGGCCWGSGLARVWGGRLQDRTRRRCEFARPLELIQSRNHC